MATYYVSSVTGLSTNNGTTWALAYDKLATAVAGAGGSPAIAVGDTVYVDDRHAETTAGAVTLAFPTTGAYVNILCADHTVATPGTGDLKTTGTVTTTGTSAITITGIAYFYGLTWNCGTGAGTANLTTGGTSNSRTVHEASTFALVNTSGGSLIKTTQGSAGASTYWYNCKVQFGNNNQSIQGQVGAITLQWKNSPSAIAGATLPLTLFTQASYGDIICEGVDFSALVSKAIPYTTQGGRLVLKDCLFPATVTSVAEIVQGPDGAHSDVIRSDNLHTYRVEHGAGGGIVQTETTIVRTGGASDGTTQFSRKITTSATATRCSFLAPLNVPPLAIWNNQTGSRTVTVHATSNLAAGAFPNNDDIWIEVTYLGSATTPLASFANNTKANVLASNSAYTSDLASWSGSPAGGTFAMSVGPITVNQVGYIYVTVRAAKTSTVFYVDPLIILS